MHFMRIASRYFAPRLLDILLGGHQLPRALARGSGSPFDWALATALIFKCGLKPKSEEDTRPQAEARGN